MMVGSNGLPASPGSFVARIGLGAATLLASVERRSAPDQRVLIVLLRHRPARPGGAVFNTLRLVASFGVCWPSALNIAPRWQAAWWRERSHGWDAFLVLNIARRRQAPPWRPTRRCAFRRPRSGQAPQPRVSAAAQPRSATLGSRYRRDRRP